MKDFGTAIILAGGKSSRMGFDKQFLKIDKRRLMDKIINKLRPDFHEIIIVTNKPGHYLGLSQIIREDIILGKGPLSGIHSGLKAASSNYSLVVACDMPNLNMDYISYMKDHIGQHGVTTRFGDWIEPFSSFYSKEMVAYIEDYLRTGKRSIHDLLLKLDINYIDEDIARSFSPSWDMFLNLNTKEDLDSYLNHGPRQWSV